MLDLLKRIGAIEEPHTPPVVIINRIACQTKGTSGKSYSGSCSVWVFHLLRQTCWKLCSSPYTTREPHCRKKKFPPHSLCTADHSSLFNAMVRHGLDIISRCYKGLPLLVYAVRSRSAEIVEHMLDLRCRARAGWTSRKAKLEGGDYPVVATSTTSEVNIDSRVGRHRILQMTCPTSQHVVEAAGFSKHYIVQAFSATKPATLFQAALHTNPDTLEFLLATQCWNSADVCDATLSAICLLHDGISVSNQHHCNRRKPSRGKINIREHHLPQ